MPRAGHPPTDALGTATLERQDRAPPSSVLAPEILFRLPTTAAGPIYHELTQQITRHIASGRLRPGDELPSIRDVARALSVNMMTVQRAYSTLAESGVLTARRGHRTTVAPKAAVHRVPERSVAELLRPALERAAQEAHELGMTPEAALALFARALASGSAGCENSRRNLG